MLFKKILLSSALISMAGLMACGDDSSSNSGSGELPPSVPTFFDLEDVECNADRKCETIIVEDGPDTYECNGEGQWNMLINSMPSKVCPAEEEKKTEGDENKAPESSASDSGDNDGDSSSSAEEVTGPTGDLVSCVVEMFGEKACDEVAKADEAKLSAQCELIGGTINTAGGCKADDYAAKCSCKTGNHYDSSCDGFTCND